MRVVGERVGTINAYEDFKLPYPTDRVRQNDGSTDGQTVAYILFFLAPPTPYSPWNDKYDKLEDNFSIEALVGEFTFYLSYLSLLRF